jgi:hypothetical protein
VCNNVVLRSWGTLLGEFQLGDHIVELTIWHQHLLPVWSNIALEEKLVNPVDGDAAGLDGFGENEALEEAS